MSQRHELARRAFLRGLGTTIALPALESLQPATSVMAAGSEAAPPTRLAFLFVPNGIIMKDWTPEKVGTKFELPRTLASLEKYRDDFTLLSGLAQDQAHAHGNGAGDHARSAAVFLTGVHPVKTAGKDMRVGTSVDQLAAQHIGHLTRFPSLELGCQSGRLAGSCDSGYGCAYQHTLSWKTPTQPLAKETNPGLVFDRLVGGGSSSEQRTSKQRRQNARQSVLDFVADDARRLQPKLGSSDRRKVEQYLEGIREIEQRLESPTLAENKAGIPRPDRAPDDFGERIRLMGDLMVLAFASDATRICTLMIANEGSNYRYGELGQGEGHHSMSHHRHKADLIEKLQKIDEYHVKQLAYIISKLKETDENGQSLLDNTLLVYGSGISDGNRHNHHDLPILTAGRGGGIVTPGRHVRYPEATPLMNLYVSMLQGIGAPVKQAGDSTGALPGLTA